MRKIKGKIDSPSGISSAHQMIKGVWGIEVLELKKKMFIEKVAL
jgi:hypothetical protein